MKETPELRKLMQKFVNYSENKLELVLPEEVDGVYAGAVAFGVVDEMTNYINEHPDCKFSDIFSVLPDGVAPGAEGE